MFGVGTSGERAKEKGYEKMNMIEVLYMHA
jgi:hypothetical protein